MADPAAPTATKSPNVTDVCVGATLPDGRDGQRRRTETCVIEYSHNGGTWTTTLTPFAAVSGTNTIAIRKNCNGSGCDLSTESTYTWTAVADPAAPVIAKSPNVATVCEDQTLTITVTTAGSGGTGTCVDEYRYSTDNGGTWSTWSSSLPSFAAVTGTNLVESRRNCDGSGCNSNVNQVSWVVVADPVAPEIAKSPNVATVCEGTTLTITVTTAGSGGTGTCVNEYRFSTNNGSSWSSWSSSLPNFAAVTGTNLVESRRNCDGSGCISNVNQVSWSVNAEPSNPIALNDVTVCLYPSGNYMLMANTPAVGTGT
ncbi:MAG: hypothetical protein IPN33_23940 [Saprospiraceae bacterium]|nr:hypothetical protein [Saprospiraceae bacterium]